MAKRQDAAQLVRQIEQKIQTGDRASARKLYRQIGRQVVKNPKLLQQIGALA